MTKDLPKSIRFIIREILPHETWHDPQTIGEHQKSHIKYKNINETLHVIYIKPKKLYEIEEGSETISKSIAQMLYVFLHECAHCLTSNEEETDAIVARWIKESER